MATTHTISAATVLVDDLSQIKNSIALLESREQLLKQALIAEVEELDSKLSKGRRAERKHFRFPKAPKVRRKCIRI